MNMTADMVDDLKKDWIMYNCNGWIGIHKVTGKKIKTGTYISLLNSLYNMV